MQEGSARGGGGVEGESPARLTCDSLGRKIMVLNGL
jgi:hypothetical protein